MEDDGSATAKSTVLPRLPLAVLLALALVLGLLPGAGATPRAREAHDEDLTRWVDR